MKFSNFLILILLSFNFAFAIVRLSKKDLVNPLHDVDSYCFAFYNTLALCLGEDTLRDPLDMKDPRERGLVLIEIFKFQGQTRRNLLAEFLERPMKYEGDFILDALALALEYKDLETLRFLEKTKMHARGNLDKRRATVLAVDLFDNKPEEFNLEFDYLLQFINPDQISFTLLLEYLFSEMRVHNGGKLRNISYLLRDALGRNILLRLINYASSRGIDIHEKRAWFFYEGTRVDLVTGIVKPRSKLVEVNFADMLLIFSHELTDPDIMHYIKGFLDYLRTGPGLLPSLDQAAITKLAGKARNIKVDIQ